MSAPLRLLTAAAVLAGAGLAAAPAHAETDFLPAVTLNLKAARYAPSATDLVWEGWMGGAFDLVRVNGTTFYLSGNVETTLGNTRREFEATEANYHLEPGFWRSFGDRDYGIFYHHVSRHAEDRSKPEAVDWNLLGVRASMSLPKGFPRPTRLTFSIAKATQHSLVDYRWELVALTSSDILTRPAEQVFLRTNSRLVLTERNTVLYHRDGFLDFQAETGVRFRRDSRVLELFLAYDHRNDVLIDVPETENRAMLGFHVMYGRRLDPKPEVTPSRE